MAKGQKEAKVVFTAEVSEFTKGITQINKSLSNLKSDLKACNADIKANGQSYDNLSNKQKTLKGVVDGLTDKLEMQRKCLAQAEATLGKGSEQYNRYYRAVNNTQAELTKFERELKDVEQALEQVDNEADGDGFRDLENNLDGAEVATIGLGSALADLATGAFNACIGKIQEFCGYLAQLPEATEEVRNSMARIDASAQSNDKSVYTLKEQYKELYGYFADSNACANMVNNLSQLDVSNGELMTTVDSCTAVYSRFGDQIENEGFAEAILHTVKMGEVQGTLADAIEWTGGSVEDFNTKLATCQTEQEKLRLINEYITAEYGESKQIYDEKMQTQIAMNQATADTIAQEAKLAEAILPVQTAWQNLKTQALDALAPAIESIAGVLQKCVEWFAGLPEPVQQAIGVITAVTVVVTALAVGIGMVVAVVTALNVALLPIIAIILAVIAVISAIVLAIMNWGEITAWLTEKWNQFKTWIASLWDSIKAKCSEVWEGMKTAISNVWNSIKSKTEEIWNSVKSFISNIWEGIKTAIKNAIDNVKNSIQNTFDNIKNTITNIWNGIKSTTSNVWNGIKSAISNVVNGIKSNIQTSFNNIKSTVSNVFNSIKSVATSVWNGIKSSITSVVNGIKSSISSAFNSVKSTVSSVFNSVKSTITSAMNSAKSTVTSAISKIKSMFSSFKIKWSIPKPSLPSFNASIKWTTTTVLGKSFRYPSGISWHKLGGIFTQPTLFATPGGMHGVGEAGAKIWHTIQKCIAK